MKGYIYIFSSLTKTVWDDKTLCQINDNLESNLGTVVYNSLEIVGKTFHDISASLKPMWKETSFIFR